MAKITSTDQNLVIWPFLTTTESQNLSIHVPRKRNQVLLNE